MSGLGSVRRAAAAAATALAAACGSVSCVAVGTGALTEHVFRSAPEPPRPVARERDQRVLVIFVRTSDDGTPEASFRDMRQGEEGEFASIQSFFGESSLGQLSFRYAFDPPAGFHTLPRTFDDYVWTRQDLERAEPGSAERDEALRSLGLLSDVDALIEDSLSAAHAGGCSFEGCRLVVISVLGGFLRGTSFGPTYVSLESPGREDVSLSLPVVVVATSTGWSRTAHEFGHAFCGFFDLYTAKPSDRMGSWDLMDVTDSGSQTSGWHKDRMAHWLDPNTVRVIPRPGEGERVEDVTRLFPYEQRTSTPGCARTIRLDVAPGHSLYVECRRRVPGQVGSQRLPRDAVIVTEGQTEGADGGCPVRLAAPPLAVEKPLRDARWGDLEVTLVEDGRNPAIRTSWAYRPFVALTFAPRSAAAWESPDIWVDSPANGYGVFDEVDERRNPVGRGDEPMRLPLEASQFGGASNRVCARVTNGGNATAEGVTVRFLADQDHVVNGTWRFLGSIALPRLLAGESRVVSVPWSGMAVRDPWFRVEAETASAERAVSAEERIMGYGSYHGSPFAPVEDVLQVHNPSGRRLRIRVEMSGLPSGWSGSVRPRSLVVDPGGTGRSTFRIVPGNGPADVPGRRANVQVEARAYVGDEELAIGGVTCSIRLLTRSKVELRMTAKTIPAWW